MASPVGHVLIGLALGRVVGPGMALPPRNWLVLAAVAANAPDLDLVPGLFLGDVNRFHQGISHSLLAAAIFGVAMTLLVHPLSSNKIRIGLVGAALYASHLALDFFTGDKRGPFGTPLLWPFSSGHFISPWTPFKGVTHGVPGDTLLTTLVALFSWHNLWVIGLEMLALAPLLLLAWRLSISGHERSARSGAPEVVIPIPK